MIEPLMITKGGSLWLKLLVKKRFILNVGTHSERAHSE